MKIKALKGVQDILPADIAHWNFLESQAEQIFNRYGYQQIKIPIIEESCLFSRSIGQETDIIEKEMYTFVDRGMRKIALRPEATASVVRAYLEHNLDQQGLVKLFYSGPMFRGENPQAGRNRQFYQIGVEALGSNSPYLDAEVILLAVSYLQAIGLKKFHLFINSVGNNEDKKNFSKILKDHLEKIKPDLCKSCQGRYERSVLRILDCKNKACNDIIRTAPNIIENLSKESKEDFIILQNALKTLKVEYTIMPHLVRGLDYYTKTVFEITHEELGAQNTILAGGRYDNLIEELGGAPTGAIGFACGIERLLIAAGKENIQFPKTTEKIVYAIALGEPCFIKLFEITQILRKNQVPAILNFEQRSLKSQMRQADKSNCAFALILVDNELKSNSIIIKDMQSGQQHTANLENVVEELKNKINEKNG